MELQSIGKLIKKSRLFPDHPQNRSRMELQGRVKLMKKSSALVNIPQNRSMMEMQDSRKQMKNIGNFLIIDRTDPGWDGTAVEAD